MKTNTKAVNTLVPKFTHQGGPASRNIGAIEELRRATMACMLWENSFYESGVSTADRIAELVSKCNPADVASLAIGLRTQGNLRHVPLLLVRELARHPKIGTVKVADVLVQVIQRPDELSEFMSIYWKGGRTPIAAQVKKGLARAFNKFNEYSLAKYDQTNATVKLKDVLFMVHNKPADAVGDGEVMAAVAKPNYRRGTVARHADALLTKLKNGTMAFPGTWENRLSAGEDKKAVFEELLSEGKLGYLALLRNLRNMAAVGVDEKLIFKALQAGALKSKALPFRFVAAARAVPQWEHQLSEAMQTAAVGLPKLPGKTVVLVDVSGSMESGLSGKSDLNRMDAAAALAVLVRATSDDARIFTFSTQVVEVPNRKGLALLDAVIKSQPHGGTELGAAVEHVKKKVPDMDRLIVITDEQSADRVGKPLGKGYMINVATYQNGVGYGDWTKINGFSESIVAYIAAVEAEGVS